MVLTTSMLTTIRTAIKSDIEAIMTHGAIGVDNTTPNAADTTLTQEVFRDAIDDFDDSQSDRITASLIIGTNEANGNSIKEAGWLDAASVSVDDCDTADWTDSADMTTTVNPSTYKEGGVALNLTKDNTGSATASTSKTTTSVDFTSKKLSVWIYILDTTTRNLLATSDCLVIRFGSDGSNYYQWAKDKADLAVGWNLVQGLTSANADSTTGTPSLLAMDYTYVAVVTAAAGSTWSAGAVIMDDIKLTSGTLYTHHTLTAINKTDAILLYLDTQIVITVTEV